MPIDVAWEPVRFIAGRYNVHTCEKIAGKAKKYLPEFMKAFQEKTIPDTWEAYKAVTNKILFSQKLRKEYYMFVGEAETKHKLVFTAGYADQLNVQISSVPHLDLDIVRDHWLSRLVRHPWNRVPKARFTFSNYDDRVKQVGTAGFVDDEQFEADLGVRVDEILGNVKS